MVYNYLSASANAAAVSMNAAAVSIHASPNKSLQQKPKELVVSPPTKLDFKKDDAEMA